MRITISNEPCPCHDQKIPHFRAIDDEGTVVQVVHLNRTGLSALDIDHLAGGLSTMHVLLHPPENPAQRVQPAPGMQEAS